MSNDSSFQTFWGNALLGIYATWTHQATDTTTPTAEDKLAVTFDINLYAAGVITEAGGTYLATADAVKIYLLILNPVDRFD